MDKGTILQAIEGARAKGSFKLKIVFTLEATMAWVGNLLWIERYGIVEIDDKTKTTLLNVASSNKWLNDTDRVSIVTITDDFDPAYFVEKVGPGLQQIEAAAA